MLVKQPPDSGLNSNPNKVANSHQQLAKVAGSKSEISAFAAYTQPILYV